MQKFVIQWHNMELYFHMLLVDIEGILFDLAHLKITENHSATILLYQFHFPLFQNLFNDSLITISGANYHLRT